VREPLTAMLIADQLKRLFGAFPASKLASQNPSFTAETYKDGLKGIDGEMLRAAVDRCIQEDQYFPRIARLRELAFEWRRRNRDETPAAERSTWNHCGICGAEAQPEQITRPKLFDKDASAAHYRTAQETRFETGVVWPAGHPVQRGLLLWAQENGVRLEMETVEGRQLVMNHKPGPHHVHRERQEDVA
jgi:hypothetical protein